MFPTLLASLLGLAVALPGIGWADDHDHKSPYPGGPEYHGGYHGPYRGGPGYYGRYYPNYYGRYYPHYYPPYHPGYGCTNCGKQQHHHNNHNNDNEKWWYGLGGGILGYTLGNVFPFPGSNQNYVPPPDSMTTPAVNTAPPPRP